MVIAKIGENLPKTCDECKLFVNGIIGHPAYCVLDAKYTDKEIDTEKDGNLNMYYYGCLSHRPCSCPLEQI